MPPVSQAEITPLIVITAVAKAHNVEPGQILSRSETYDAPRDMAIWLTMRLMKPAWSPHEVSLAFNRDARYVVQTLRRARARYQTDNRWRNRALELRNRLRPQKGRMEVAPSQNSMHAPPIAGDEVNWGFTSHAGGRHYLADQNTAFCEAMRKAIERGDERLPAPVES